MAPCCGSPWQLITCRIIINLTLHLKIRIRMMVFRLCCYCSQQGKVALESSDHLPFLQPVCNISSKLLIKIIIIKYYFCKCCQCILKLNKRSFYHLQLNHVNSFKLKLISSYMCYLKSLLLFEPLFFEDRMQLSHLATLPYRECEVIQCRTFLQVTQKAAVT